MRTIAFYLPQFHAIPENDAWWGEGFTEWTNVDRARPFFTGHRQPREPGELGRYSLLDRETLRQQSELARAHGIDAFCIYFYWFDGQRLLEKPLDLWAEDDQLLPYCLSWANESWTRRWDGKEREVLMAQSYAPGFEEGLFKDLLPHFENPRYLRVHGEPILLVHRPLLIPGPCSFAKRIRTLAVEAGLPGIHLVGAETVPNVRPEPLGLDAIAEFPPVGANTLATAQLRPVKGIDRAYRGRLMSYTRLASRYMRRREPAHVRYSGVAPGWDNTARRMANGTLYLGATPETFARWIAHARSRERQLRGDRGLVFVNAWNEWAEGAYLEPDSQFGKAYLHASLHEEAPPGHEGTIEVHHRLLWSYPQMRSIFLAAAGSALAAYRKAQIPWPRLDRSVSTIAEGSTGRDTE